MASNEEKEYPFIPEGLTSAVYGPENPPKDWADAGFLIPHEALRFSMNKMLASAEALKDDYEKKESWKVLYFAEWYVEDFASMVHDHHSNEEDIYFPWVATKAELPEKVLSKQHEDLVKMLEEMKSICISVKKKKGIKCADEIQKLKEKIPLFIDDMNEHLKEEEEGIPELLRANFTHEEEQVVVGKIIKAEGLGGTRRFLPTLLEVMDKWAKPSFKEIFLASIPPPIQKLLYDYYIPDYNDYVCPKRDAPTLSEKPKIVKVKCCKLPFCCNCVV